MESLSVVALESREFTIVTTRLLVPVAYPMLMHPWSDVLDPSVERPVVHMMIAVGTNPKLDCANVVPTVSVVAAVNDPILTPSAT